MTCLNGIDKIRIIDEIYPRVERQFNEQLRVKKEAFGSLALSGHPHEELPDLKFAVNGRKLVRVNAGEGSYRFDLVE